MHVGNVSTKDGDDSCFLVISCMHVCMAWKFTPRKSGDFVFFTPGRTGDPSLVYFAVSDPLQG